MIGEDWQTRQSGDLVVLVLHLRTRPSSARRFMLMAKMSEPESRIRNISDTARWVAVYRARETERRDAVFRDAFARCARAVNSSRSWIVGQIEHSLSARGCSFTSTKNKSRHLAKTLPLPRAFSTGLLTWLHPRS